VVQCLPSKHKALSSKPHTGPPQKKRHKKKKKIQFYFKGNFTMYFFGGTKRSISLYFFFCGV
jgi:hypothetical protein